MLAFQPRKRFAKDTVLIVDGTLVPIRDHTVAEQSKNYRYSTNHQVVIDTDTRLVVMVGGLGTGQGCTETPSGRAVSCIGRGRRC
jgi:hypothetical protein